MKHRFVNTLEDQIDGKRARKIVDDLRFKVRVESLDREPSWYKEDLHNAVNKLRNILFTLY